MQQGLGLHPDVVQRQTGPFRTMTSTPNHAYRYSRTGSWGFSGSQIGRLTTRLGRSRATGGADTYHALRVHLREAKFSSKFLRRSCLWFIGRLCQGQIVTHNLDNTHVLVFEELQKIPVWRLLSGS